MSILGAAVVPHPPLIIPGVGHGEEKIVQKTIDAYREVGRRIGELQPNTLIVSSPHALMYSDYFHISPGRGAEGSFAQFNDPGDVFRVSYDRELVRQIESLAEADHFPAGTLGERTRELDHGTMVPLYFINPFWSDYKLVRIGLSGLSLADHYRLGMIIQQAVNRLGRRAFYVASGDLSHKTREAGPYGYDPAGPEYDKRVMDVLGRADFGELLDFDEAFCDQAAECGHRSFVIMAGALDGLDVEGERLSLEEPTGVGYGVAFYRPVGESESASASDAASDAGRFSNRETGESGAADAPESDTASDARCSSNQEAGKSGTAAASHGRHFLAAWEEKEKERLQARKIQEDSYVQLARQAIESYIGERRWIDPPENLPQEIMTRQAGCFVSLHEKGQLRGCIGTISATMPDLAQEIIHNAISAASRDPRFPAISKEELPFLEYSVDVLGPTEPIASIDQLDPRRYGVIVTAADGRRGLLLPDLEGVDTVEEQVRIARRKAGIALNEEVQLERFEVVRHV